MFEMDETPVWRFVFNPQLAQEFGTCVYQVDGLGEVECSYFERSRACDLDFSMKSNGVAAIDATAKVKLVKIKRAPKRNGPRPEAWYAPKKES